MSNQTSEVGKRERENKKQKQEESQGPRRNKKGPNRQESKDKDPKLNQDFLTNWTAKT